MHSSLHSSNTNISPLNRIVFALQKLTKVCRILLMFVCVTQSLSITIVIIRDTLRFSICTKWKRDRLSSWNEVTSCVSVTTDWTRLLCSQTILDLGWINVGVFSVEYQRSFNVSYIETKYKFSFIISSQLLAVPSCIKMNRILTYFFHMSENFPSCRLHLVHSWWKRLLIIVP